MLLPLVLAFARAVVPAPNGSPGIEGGSAPATPARAQPSDADGVESPFLESIKTLVQSDDMKIQWGGRVQLDAGFFGADDDYPGGDDDGAEFRRARIYAKGDLYQAIDFMAEYDFASGTPKFTDVFIGYKTSIGRIQVGHFKQPFGLEQLTSDNYTTFLERSMVDEALTPARDDGIQWAETFGDATNLAIGAFRRTDDSGKDTGDGDYEATARLTHAFLGSDGNVVHVGVAASERAGLPNERISFRPEAHLQNLVFDTGNITTDGLTLYEGELAWVHGPFSVQGEYMLSQADSVNGAQDADFSGWYAFVSWFLTGESRPYKAKGGVFDRTQPSSNYTGTGLGGAWELALRYSTVDADDGAFATTVDNITAALNWYLNPHSRIGLNVVLSNAQDDLTAVDADSKALLIRWHIDW